MTKIELEGAFSSLRVSKYFVDIETEKDGILRYHNSQNLSSIFYLPISVFEIILRNKVNGILGRKWRNITSQTRWEVWLKNKGLDNIRYTANQSGMIYKMGKLIAANGVGSGTMDRRTSFPTLGFYTRFFDIQNSNLFKETLVIPVFTIPGKDQVFLTTKRKESDDVFYKIRTLRNRIFHFETLRNKYTAQYLIGLSSSIYEYIELFNIEAYLWLEEALPLTELHSRVYELYEV